MSLTVDSGGVALHVEQAGPDDGELVVLLHGFPELAYSWRHQIPTLAGAGYRVLAPELRGYGRSGVPDDLREYAIDRLIADVVALIDHAGREQACLVGHDWGADIAWKTAWQHPERVRAVAGLSVPFLPPSSGPPVGMIRAGMGEDFYIVWFQQEGEPEDALELDVRETLLAAMVPDGAWALVRDEPCERPAFLSEADLAVYVDAFERTGFRGPLNLYRNIDRNWELLAGLADRTITPSALFLTGELDPVRHFMDATAMDGWVDDLRRVVVPGVGHWVQQEAPDAVDAALLEFLGTPR